MRVLVAFDKFKDALTAPAACAAAAGALRAAHPDWEVEECPLADGGEGFGEILTAAAGGRRTAVEVTGPRGGRRRAAYGMVAAEQVAPAAARRLGGAAAGRWGVVEMAEASGLAMLRAEERDAWVTTSVGTGELICAAAGAGADGVLLGVGGSATNDLGLGALAALGLRFLDKDNNEVFPPYPADWHRIVRIDADVSGVSAGMGSNTLQPPGSGRVGFIKISPARGLGEAGAGQLRASGPHPIALRVVIACDVGNPLLGGRGAAAVYGPQKGLRKEDLPRMEREMERMARMLWEWARARTAPLEAVETEFAASTRFAGAGAAGGIAYGLRVALGAELVAGAELISDWVGLPARLAAADVVITGEGRFDDSSVEGKGPGAVAAAAVRLGKAAHVFAGRVAVSPERTPAGYALHSITPEGTPLAEALRGAELNLRSAITRQFAPACTSTP